MGPSDLIRNAEATSLLEQRALVVCDGAVWEERTLIQGAVEVLEISKMQEIVTILANLRDAALQLPDGPERQNALREIKDFQIRLAAFVRRLCSTA